MERIHKVENELLELAKYRDEIDKLIIEKLNEYNLETSQDYVQYALDNRVFLIEGWIPENKVAKLENLLKTMDVHGEEVAIEESDKVPSFLENSGYSEIGEDLVHIYDTPSINDKDPSLWVLWSFALFFAIILGDGGYGLLFLAGTFYMYRKFPGIKGLGKRMLKLAAILSVSCILWGTLTTSFFGIQFGIDSPLRKVSMIQWLVEKKADYHLSLKDDVYHEYTSKYVEAKEATTGYAFVNRVKEFKKGKLIHVMLTKFSDKIMLELALLLGMVHICLSLLRNLRSHWAGIGWVLFIVGAYLYFPSMLQATSMAHFVLGLSKEICPIWGSQLILGGISLAVVLALAQHKASGAVEILTIIQVFSDVLSYLRLYALGLAGAMMSATFNEIGQNVGFFLGIIVIIIGHTVNITLSIMGGVIHGLRLNFLEWYHYSFEGGGKNLVPLKLLKRN